MVWRAESTDFLYGADDSLSPAGVDSWYQYPFWSAHRAQCPWPSDAQVALAACSSHEPTPRHVSVGSDVGEGYTAVCTSGEIHSPTPARVDTSGQYGPPECHAPWVFRPLAHGPITTPVLQYATSLWCAVAGHR